MAFRFEVKTVSKNKRKSTIVIQEQEDSLLVEPVFKDFLQTQNSDFRHNRSKLTPSNKNPIMKLTNTSQGFFSTPSTKNKIINPQKLTYISQINFKTFDNWEALLPYSSAKKQTQSKIPQSQTPKTSNIALRKDFSTLLDNRKKWTSHLLQKTISDSKKKMKNYHSTNENLNLSKNNRESLMLKGQLLKNVSSSTWMKLNPENMKQDMIFLSKTQKYERKNYFAMQQASQNQQSGIKSLNKRIMLGRSVSDKSFNSSKQKINVKNELGIKISLSARNLVSQKVYERRQKRREELQKKGIFLRNPLREQPTARHDVLVNVSSEFL